MRPQNGKYQQPKELTTNCHQDCQLTGSKRRQSNNNLHQCLVVHDTYFEKFEQNRFSRYFDIGCVLGASKTVPGFREHLFIKYLYKNNSIFPVPWWTFLSKQA